ncbi:MAG: sigma-70 family RNA polymerase sigma factor [Thermomicrobiales bacterium]
MQRRHRRKDADSPPGECGSAAPRLAPDVAPASTDLRGGAPSDAALVRAAQRDPLAFAPLYQRYATPVYRYCLRQTSDPETAADLTAQIFTKALEALPRFRVRDDTDTFGASGTTLRSWLFAIAHNAIVDARRRERPTQSLHAIAPHADERRRGDAPLDALADPGIGPEEFAVHRDELGRLVAVLDRLPESQRQIVELRLAGLTTAEVAEALGLTRPAVKAAQTRAYSRLRDLLEPPEPQPPSPDGPQHPSHPATSSAEEVSQ